MIVTTSPLVAKAGDTEAMVGFAGVAGGGTDPPPVEVEVPDPVLPDDDPLDPELFVVPELPEVGGGGGGGVLVAAPGGLVPPTIDGAKLALFILEIRVGV